MSAHAPLDRYHALDSLRGFAMFLGVVLHVGISFMTVPPAFWPVRDNDPSSLADVFLIAVHDFRMQTFFLLAGFFGCLLYQRYGLTGLLSHRVKRVFVPFILAIVLIVPTVQAAGVYCEAENIRAESAQPGSVRGEPSPLRPIVAKILDANPEASSTQIVGHFFASGESFARLPLVHLWFLYYLLIFVVIVVILTPLLGRLTGTRLLARIDTAFRWVIESRWRVLIPALLTFPLMLTMAWIVDTPTRWKPQWHILGYYLAFFAFGWMLFRHRDLVPTFGSWWGPHLFVANVVVLPVLLVALFAGAAEMKVGGDPLPWKLGVFTASALYTWLMITGLWGAFLRLFSREFAWVRYMADSAYWCYIASITPIVVFQFVVKDWPLPGLLKCAFVTVATMAVLLASYEWCVRYTFIGAILNGRKYRTRAATAKAPAAAGAAEPVRV